MLPGMSGGIGGTFNIKGLVHSTSGTTSSGTTVAVNRPSGYQAGDIFVAVMIAVSGTGKTWTGDSGWTELVDQNATGHNMRVATLVAGAGEPSSYTFTASATAELIAHILCFRGYAYDTIGASVATLSDSGNIAMTGITSAGGILIAAAASQNFTPPPPTIGTPSGMQLIQQTGSNGGLATFYKLVSAGATGTVNSAVTVDDPGALSCGILIGLSG